LTIDSALKSCDYLKKFYVDAITKPPSIISPDEGIKLADDFFKSLREPLLKSIDDFFIQPNFAESRSKVVVLQWRECVENKAKSWSRLTDDARTIAEAAVTACQKERQNASLAFGFQLRSKSLPSEKSEQLADNIAKKMTDVAIEKIISERAMRLPNRR